MPSATPAADVRDAVRETVSYRQSSDRTRASRSNTTVVPQSSSAAKPSTRRSHSQDGAPVQEKSRSSGKSRSKKGSQHADVIDRLDFTGVGPMFHHDGPFDACAPSRNKHKTQAPMHAWSPQPEELNQPSSTGGAYPSAYAYGAFSNNYAEPPKKKVDAIAEAWGIHEPEPFEEFFAGGGSGRQDGDTPASSIYNGKSSRRTKDESPRESRSRAPPRRVGVPPPQPIFVPEATESLDSQTGSPPANSPGFPKRTKSLMQRIRKMRDAPNVPVGAEYETPPSPSTPTGPTYEGRPTHKSQNSFLGRFGVKSNQSALPPSSYKRPEPYIFIDNQNMDKALPAPPRAERDPYAPENTAFTGSQQGGAQLGRKTSLIKRVGKVVRGK
ncbi:hypothetical protein EST38_g12142 [Candolleomyces aberdarensis]|uniref:Pal1-domain-containing protein n=1 Tax=Candolleomyces aberdarensis TaxID=2316362 RepID=A0A4Q2D5F3_9AGAR|nr:hypothetical protein EST38_g12142 [Candolleomyces aberdarensis]